MSEREERIDAAVRAYWHRRRFHFWLVSRKWIPHRICSGVSERKWRAWRWLGRYWWKRYVETEETFQERRRRYLEWKASRRPITKREEA